MCKLCAIILNWNNYEETRDCIMSLVHSERTPDSIILVDNGSTDNSSLLLKTHFGKKITIINNSTNKGFAAGINVGIEAACRNQSDYLLLLNNDAIVDRKCIGKMLHAFDNSENIGICGPRIYYYFKPEIIWQGGGYFNYLTGGNVVPEKNHQPVSYIAKNRRVSFLTGCVMLIKRNVIENIGMFNERIYFYEEDVDYCLRARNAGFKLLYVTEAYAWHKVKGIKITEFAFFHRARSRLIVLRDNFQVPYFIYGIFMHIIYYTPYKLYQSITRNTVKPFVAWLLGSLDGLKASRRE